MQTAVPIAAAFAACSIAGALFGCSRPGAGAAVSASPAPSGAAVSASPAPSDATVPARLCAAPRRIAPQLEKLPEVGARAQRVMGVAGAFDSDAIALQTVSRDIDTIAAQGCAEVRAPLLAATRAASLREAVR